MKKQKKQKINIKANNEDLKGFYSNFMRVSHKKEEFFLDFFSLVGQEGVLGSRIIVSPNHLKRIINTLQASANKYEDQFGGIEESETPKKQIGFVTEN